MVAEDGVALPVVGGADERAFQGHDLRHARLGHLDDRFLLALRVPRARQQQSEHEADGGPQQRVLVFHEISIA